MTNDTRTAVRWIPAVVVLVVAALLLGGWWLTRPGDASSQPTPGGAAPPGGSGGSGGPASPAPKPSARPLAVSVTGYRVVGSQRLVLEYAIGLPRCDGVLAPPQVAETSTTVTVTLHRIPVPVPPQTACPQLAMIKTVEVPLRSPLGGRTVRDGSLGTVVPPGTASTPGATPLQ